MYFCSVSGYIVHTFTHMVRHYCCDDYITTKTACSPYLGSAILTRFKWHNNGGMLLTHIMLRLSFSDSNLLSRVARPICTDKIIDAMSCPSESFH